MKLIDPSGAVRLYTPVIEICHERHAIREIIVGRRDDQERLPVSHAIPSMPITEFITKLRPAPPADVLAAARRLHYRALLYLCLIVNRKHLFPDNWIYIDEPGVKGRTNSNFKNWSRDMVPDSEKSSLGLEYFCQEGDELWSLPDSELIALATRETARIGLADLGGCGGWMRLPCTKGLSHYDSTYQDALAMIERYIQQF